MEARPASIRTSVPPGGAGDRHGYRDVHNVPSGVLYDCPLTIHDAAGVTSTPAPTSKHHDEAAV